jgi:GNAT superfamily N-acetyltransferase
LRINVVRRNNRRMPAKVRDAVVADAAELRAVASSAWRDTYGDLLRPATVEAFVEAAYSVEMLERRIDRSTFLVVEDGDRIIAFANAIAGPDRLNLAAIYALPDRRGQGAGTMLLTVLRARFPSLPVAADVLSGNRKGEVFYEHRGFVRGEALEDELFGEPVVERRWWLGTPPLVGADEP